MKINNEAIERLNSFGVKPSMQRLAVMTYLLKHRTHPTVEAIYLDLCSQIPTLSKTTVYNTVKLLVEQGAVAELTIDDKNLRYDSDISTHAHFKCCHCGYLCDIPVRKSTLLSVKKIGGLTVSESQLYYKGYCEKCSKLMEKI
ncbi:MAG: transcriptional repressor [Cytophagaceae bacterium]|jgi:Fe2+ or Zn2+ uptake regulation protein|nr:transcriptional repressor [Cytophagaceae bacterium]